MELSPEPELIQWSWKPDHLRPSDMRPDPTRTVYVSSDPDPGPEPDPCPHAQLYTARSHGFVRLFCLKCGELLASMKGRLPGSPAMTLNQRAHLMAAELGIKPAEALDRLQADEQR